MSTLPEMMLEDLRWKAGQPIVNHFGESVYLKQIPTCITDCCFTSDPCPDHGGSGPTYVQALGLEK